MVLESVNTVNNILDLFLSDNLSLVLRKPVFGVSNQVRYKPGCAATKYSQRLEISDLGNRGIVLYV